MTKVNRDPKVGPTNIEKYNDMMKKVPREGTYTVPEVEFVKLKECYVRDQQKPKIDQWERAGILRSLMIDKGWSERQLGDHFGISHSTVHDWLLLDQLSRSEYDTLLSQGFTPTSIYRALRDKKGFTKPGPVTALDVFLTDTRLTLKRYKRDEVVSNSSVRTPDLIQDLINELANIAIYINKKG